MVIRDLLRHPQRVRVECRSDRCQVEQLMTLAEKFDVEYDGWGLTLKIPTAKTATMKILSMKT